MIKTVIKNASFLALIATVLVSCSTSSDVVQDQYIQKRKYRKGYFKEKRSKQEIQEYEFAQEVIPTGKTEINKSIDLETIGEPSAVITTSHPPCIIPWLSNEERFSGQITVPHTYNRVQGLDLSSYKDLKEIEPLSNVIFEIPIKQTIQEGESPFDKSQVGAAVFCFFLGFIGIHRFYLGYPVIGFLQIITLGGCGLWALIDFIRIVLGDLQPANGTYYDTIDF